MQIRRATPADAPALLALMHACRAYQGEYARILDGYAFSEEQFGPASGPGQVFLAERDSRVGGFYALASLDTAPELDLMFVADADQGSGLGSRLFAHLREEARRRGIALLTIVSHPPAEGFYLRMGARRVATRQPAGRVTWERPVLLLEP